MLLLPVTPVTLLGIYPCLCVYGSGAPKSWLSMQATDVSDTGYFYCDLIRMENTVICPIAQ